MGRWTTWICAAVLVCAPGCDGGGTGGASEEGPVEPEEEPAKTTAWSPDAVGTGQVPSYGNSCRFRADTHLEFSANSASDDTVILTENDDSTYGLVIAFANGDSGSCEATLELAQGLARKSYRYGSGVATATGDLSGLEGQIVDGAVCFQSKLEYAVPVSGEFTLVVLNQAGEYVSIGGDFDLAGEDVFPFGADTTGSLVDAAAVQMDLQ